MSKNKYISILFAVQMFFAFSMVGPLNAVNIGNCFTANNPLTQAEGGKKIFVCIQGDSGNVAEVDSVGQIHTNPGQIASDTDSITAFDEKVSSPTTETQISCTGTSAQLLTANASRIIMELVVVSGTGNVSICTFTPCTTAGAAIRISDVAPVGYTNRNYTGALYCITGGATIVVGVLEL